MDGNFEKNALSWGKEGAEWLRSIPEFIVHYENAWSIKVSEPFPLSYNYVAPATRADGTPAVLKLGLPQDREFRTEMDALEIFDGHGICRLLEADKANSAVLIERIIPGSPLSALDDDDKATRIIVEVAKKLPQPLPGSHSFITINEWSKAIGQYKVKFRDSSAGPLPLNLVNKAEALFKELIATSAAPVLLHGDLHHDNVVFSDKSGWVAIDPKGVAAEPAYEIAAMIRNPYERLKGIDDLKPILTSRMNILSRQTGVKPKRIHDWCFAQTMLSAIWSTEGVKGYEHALRVAVALNEINA